MADAKTVATNAAIHVGAETIKKAAKESDIWALKMLGIGLGIFTGSFAEVTAQFSSSDEHLFHKLMTRIRKDNPAEAAVLLFFLEKTFPNPGIGFNQFINIFQNRFRLYVQKHAMEKKPGEEKETYNEDLAIAFLRDEIINPIKNAPKGKNAGYKEVIRNFTALDVPMPPKGIDKILKNHEKAMQKIADEARAEKTYNPITWFLKKTTIL